MRDELDELVDRVIDAEKRNGLRRYRLNPVRLLAPESAGSATRGQAIRALFRRWWPTCAAVAAAGISLIVFLPHGQRAPAALVSSQTVERALIAARAPQIALAHAPLSVDRSGSDTYWSIQGALCRIELLRYAGQDMEIAVLRTLRKLDDLPVVRLARPASRVLAAGLKAGAGVATAG